MIPKVILILEQVGWFQDHVEIGMMILYYYYYYYFYLNFSTCNNAQWDCGSQVCATIITCPGNQIYSTNASSCPKTCDNINSWQDCGITYDGCTCPYGQVLSQDVSHL